MLESSLLTYSCHYTCVTALSTTACQGAASQPGSLFNTHGAQALRVLQPSCALWASPMPSSRTQRWITKARPVPLASSLRWHSSAEEEWMLFSEHGRRKHQFSILAGCLKWVTGQVVYPPMGSLPSEHREGQVRGLPQTTRWDVGMDGHTCELLSLI